MRPFVALSFAFLLAAAARAESVAALLMVEDSSHTERNALTERVGITVYGELLKAGPYDEIVALQGRDDANKRLAAAIRMLAARHGAIDLWLSVHSIDRGVAEMQGLVPAEARKLRLVYSSGCYGATKERAAWESLGAKTVVTHSALNNELLAMPCTMALWVEGRTIGDAVTAGWVEVQHGLPFTTSLPANMDNWDVDGSRPVVAGDASLTIGGSPRSPKELRFVRRRGTVGLVMRALGRAGFEVEGDELGVIMELLEVEDDDALRTRVVAARVLPGGALELELKEPHRIEAHGAKVVFATRVALQLERFDVAARRIELTAEGVRVEVAKGMSVGVRDFAIVPAKDGYRFRVLRHLGPVPIGKGFDIGGKTPQPLEISAPIFVAIGAPIPATSPTPQTSITGRVNR